MPNELNDDLLKRSGEMLEDFIRVQDEFRAPSGLDVTDLEEQAGVLTHDDKPERIAGNVNFFRCSRLLSQNDWLTMTDLSEGLGVEKYTATRLVAWFVEKGLAERSGNPKDRRVVRVALTKQGRDFHEILKNTVNRRTETLLQRLTPEEQNTLFDLFKKLAGR